MGKSYVMFFIDNPQYFTFLFSEHGMEMNLSLDAEDNGFPPFARMKAAAIPILNELGIPSAKLEDAVIAMWATVHGLAAIATMKNVHYDKNWEEKIEDIIWRN